ncbi:MAG: efflux RND transporter periplasmic adaptor subunit, partial [Acidobacteriales bacterium]|nr:efflux RND transporter periplasmic adaptor subunit [Terriglobales bacterium]
KYWLLLILPVLLLLWWGLDHREPRPEIHFAKVERRRIESTVSTNGKVEPAEWAAARAEAAGVVRAVSVQRGDTVSAGQTLVKLDVSPAQSDLAAAEAKKQEAQAEIATIGQGGKASQLASINDSIRTQQAAIEAAQRTCDSLQRLAAQQAATKVQVQNAKDALERAKLQLAALEDQRRTLVTTNDKAVAQAKLHDAEAAVALAQHRVGLGDITAPNSGTIYQFDLKVGAYLHPGDLVALIGNLDQVKVVVYVDEPDLGRVAEGNPVTITWDAKPGQKWWGRVNKLPTEVIALGTRTVGEVTTIVDNPNHDLLPGVTVNATITSKVVNEALTIPKAALRILRGTNGAYKLRDDSITWTVVQTGISDVNNVQIVSGLREGDHVADRVIEPSDAEIKDGMRVRAVFD